MVKILNLVIIVYDSFFNISQHEETYTNLCDLHENRR